MKALITGGAGFIGYHLACRLMEEGYEVVLADNFSRGVEDSCLKALLSKDCVKGKTVDLLKPESMKDLGDDFDYIFHLAAIIGVQNVLNHAYDVLKNNTVILLNMIEFAKTQKHLKRFVFASTSEIYAGTLQHFGMAIPTPEDTPLAIPSLAHPRTSYMLSKIYGEALLNQSGIPYTIVRPHNFYGPRMGMSHVIPELLKKAYDAQEGDKLEVFSVTHKRTFCYISDAVELIIRLAESEESLGDAFNVGNEAPEVAILEVGNRVIETVGKKLIIDAKPATPGSPERRCPDMKKTFAVTGYAGKVSLEEGIRKTYEWYRESVFNGKEISAK